MKSTVIDKAMSALLLFASTTMAHYPISSCEKPEISYVFGGNQYKICSGSDYQGTTLWAYHNIPSQEACAQQCQSYSGCVQAVYDTVGTTCHIKGASSGLKWVADDQGLVTIRLDKKCPPQGTVLTACPFDVKTFTSAQGWQYQVCPGTDYSGTTVWDVHGLKNDQECADACGKYDSCFRAVYDLVGGTCHLKASCGVQLVVNSKSDTIMFVNRPKAPSCISPSSSTTTSPLTTLKTTTISTTAVVTKPSSTTPAITTAVTTTSSSSAPTTTVPSTGLCANGAAPDSTYTASNGDVYGICKNTDFPGGDIQSPVYNVPTIEACAEACSNTAGCVASNLHRDPQICYLKGVKNGSVVNSNVDGAYLIKAAGNKSTITTQPVLSSATCQAVTVTVTASQCK